MPGDGKVIAVIRVLVGAFATRTKVTETIIEIALLLALLVGASAAERYVGKDSMAEMALFLVQVFGYLATFALFMKLMASIFPDLQPKASRKPDTESERKP